MFPKNQQQHSLGYWIDKEVKKLSKSNQQNISSAPKNYFMESNPKNIVKFFYLDILILTNVRAQTSKPSLPGQFFFSYPLSLHTRVI